MFAEHEIILLSRDVTGLLIPSAVEIYLKKGDEVIITQAMGSSFTVNARGNLVRIDGKDADVLGKEPIVEDTAPEGTSLEERLWAKFKTCYDPEIPINVVDLGLIYNCQVIPMGVNKYSALITMTLTAPGCAMGPILAEEIKQKALSLSEISAANVEIVFDPPWSQDKMSEVAKLQLGWL